MEWWPLLASQPAKMQHDGPKALHGESCKMALSGTFGANGRQSHPGVSQYNSFFSPHITKYHQDQLSLSSNKLTYVHGKSPSNSRESSANGPCYIAMCHSSDAPSLKQSWAPSAATILCKLVIILYGMMQPKYGQNEKSHLQSCIVILLLKHFYKYIII